MRNSENPAVSVIIPTYNRSHVLGRAVRSVLSQTYQDFELIVVDDGSSDATVEVVSGFADPRIRCLRHEKNRGAAAARNSGIKAARGEYIAFLDSDDEWLPEKLQKQVEALAKLPSRVGMVYTDLWKIGDDGVRKYWRASRILPEDGLVYDHLLADRLTGISLPSVVVRKECFTEVGIFDEEFPRLIDRELFMRLSKRFCFYHLPEGLVNYYETGRRISSDPELLIAARRLLLDKYYDDIKANRRSLAQHRYLIGNLLYRSGKLKEGRRYLLGAVRSYPLSIRYLTAAISSLFGRKVHGKLVG
jgi:glycosyltransferase involved in cell wall biosynthesis